MSDQQKFRHDLSTYERPTLPYRCGRATGWGKPCWQGPAWNGQCAGTSECQPTKKGDRWECQRPARAGGACERGPLPDGSCCLQRPPCVPQPSLRKRRARAGLFLFGVVFALLAAFSNPGSQFFSSVIALDPGPLSNAHAGFIGAQNCGACHDAHSATGANWWSRVLSPHDNDAKCLQCHTFAGPGRLAHNSDFKPSAKLLQPDCGSCHKEHRGNGFDPQNIDDAICGNCHKQQFSNFAQGHPEFPAAFPYEVPNAIQFDHSSHLNRHFEKSEKAAANDNSDKSAFAARARSDCTACHEVETATRDVKPATFERTCGNCHESQITSRALTLLIADDVPALGAMLLAASEDDDIDEKAMELLDSMSETGLGAFAELLEQWGIKRGSELFDGLTGEVVRAVASAWQQEEDYEPPEARLNQSGWLAGEDADGNQALRYVAREHGDEVLKAWLEVVVRLARQHPDENRQALAAETLEQLLDASEGPGACGKCHTAGITSSDASSLDSGGWGFRDSVERRHTIYAHAPHLNLLGREEACRNCHTLNPDADYQAYFSDGERQPNQFVSNFSPIRKSTCDSCHKPAKVRFDCQLCHTYHREPSFNVGFQIKRLATNE